MKKITKIEDVDISTLSFSYDDVVDGVKIKNELSIKYGIWSFIHNINVDSKSALQGLWNNFISLYGDDIERIKNALDEEYNILDNYNGNTTTTYSDSITEYGEKSTVNGTKTITNVIGETSGSITHGATSVTLGGGVDTQLNEKANSETSYNDEFLNDEKTTQTIASKTNTSQEYTDSNNTEEHTDTTTDSGNTITENAHSINEKSHTITEIKSGNLGVTTSQQMLSSELKLRCEYNFYDIIIKMFLNKYFFICD